MAAAEANEFQLAAPSTVPSPAVDGNPFLAVRLHQSFVNNLLAVSLGRPDRFASAVRRWRRQFARARRRGENPQKRRIPHEQSENAKPK